MQFVEHPELCRITLRRLDEQALVWLS
jgi:hypothetical protein